MAAKFLLNLSFSSLMTFSFLLAIPGLLFNVGKVLFLSFELFGIVGNAVAISGKSSASVSKDETSLLDGRRRLRWPVDLSLDFLTLDINSECFISRLSFFVEVKPDSRVGNERDRWARCCGLIGAWRTLRSIHDTNFIKYCLPWLLLY